MARGAKATCDRYFGQVVRARGSCERCGSRRDLQCAHIIRRHYLGDPDGVSLRHNEDNAWCLCAECHRVVDTDAVAFAALVERTIGRGLYAELLDMRKPAARRWREKDWQRERDRLRALLKELV